MKRSEKKGEYLRNAIKKLTGKRKFYRKIGKVMVRISKTEALKLS